MKLFNSSNILSELAKQAGYSPEYRPVHPVYAFENFDLELYSQLLIKATLNAIENWEEIQGEIE